MIKIKEENLCYTKERMQALIDWCEEQADNADRWRGLYAEGSKAANRHTLTTINFRACAYLIDVVMRAA